ncbi:MAG: hypothetical protein EOQ86_33765 [Mesorhizobium sp.]|uniref:hypothetical protein n=1 Tax=Mesorhizobium sp. TaxID=1871066 RepID=UPI000FE4B39A|nr:hypothetical protein [Mesorhizobium sp.]RWH69592.1 MAG: hypothetical protein EOQ85_32010 [Mesorhizobium sp.]RWH72303.1 MAG: hypothetical protein EOQ86_33765 [Mesorhizobium sp.]RWH83943.1 MAG: hypothetical protein EOQ87_32365 [Mesorhizobium sp.]RWH92526.1 MAG: hypothetical protein EOQ89_34770 [Mesorhizobium sp.]RWH96577.1 MAG: hypothetical protein EOQ88_19385 [Mesorhizobium sp.]
MIEDDRSGSRRQWLPKDQYTLDFSFGFRLDPALCCNCEGLPEHVADKPPGCASVKGHTSGPIGKTRLALGCDAVALENLNRLDYIDRVTATGVKADRP